MMAGWLNYWRTVRGRVTWDRSLLRGAWIVPWLFLTARHDRPAQRGTIAFYPQPAGPWYTIRLALAGTSIRVTRDLDQADAIMMFDDRTQSSAIVPNQGVTVLNAEAMDVSKSHVGAVFLSVFGYPLSVDPLSHIGPMVEKSDENGVHDGRLIDGPIGAARPGYVYQKLADSHIREGVTEDLRTVCVGGQAVQVFRKEKASDQRFSTTYLGTTLQEANAVFTSEEQDQIRIFCKVIGLDFGSIDILRDHRGDRRIYIVDVNKTCMPVLSMPAKDLSLSLKRIGRATEALILGP